MITRIGSIVVAGLLLAVFGTNSSAQTLTNLAVKATAVHASVESSDPPASLINDNRMGATKYWSSYHGDESLGEEAYVELWWNQHNDYLEIRAYWATEGEHILLPEEA